MTEPINIPIDMEVKSKATLNLTNTKTGEVQTMSMGAPEGMILNHYLDWAMAQGLGILGDATFYHCRLGNGSVPVQPTDTGLSGSELASSTNGVVTKEIENAYAQFYSLNPIGTSTRNSLEVTPDNKYLIAAVEEGLKTFLIDSESYSLTEVHMPGLQELSDVSVRAVAISGDYLFVSTTQSPYRCMFYLRDGDNFTFIGDFTNGSQVQNSKFSPDANYNLFVDSNNRIVLSKSDNPGVIQAFNIGTNFIEFNFIDDSLFYTQTRTKISLYEYGAESANLLGSLDFTEILAGGNDFSASFVEDRHIIAQAWRNDRVISIDVDNWPEYSFISQNTNTESFSVSRYAKLVKLKVGNDLTVIDGNSLIFLRDNYLPKYYYRLFTGGSWASYAVLNDGKTLFCLHLGNFYLLKVPEVVNKFSYAVKWTFPAGTGTGVVNEIAVQASTGSRYFLRFVLPQGFEKTDLHQLEVEVEAEVENPGVWEGVIPEGSRDGSDVNYRITMTSKQFRDFITTGYNNLSTWFGTDGTPNLRIGTSNEDTDLATDRENIRGEEIQYISSTAIREVIPYASGSLERTIRLFLEIDQGNGKIGEIVFGDRFCRVTFDPPLNKYDPEGVDEGRDPSTRLYMNLVFGWKREGE